MNLMLLLPELTALGVLLVLMLGEMFIKDFSAKKAGLVAMAGAFLVLGVLLLRSGIHGNAFGTTFRVDAASVFFKIFFVGALIPVLQMCRESFQNGGLRNPGEFLLILWSTLLGLFFLSSANDFLLLFIALEIVTLSFYIMAAYKKKDLFSIEAGLKYLIIGSLASAFFIFGISLLYVGSGTTSLPAVAEFYRQAPHNTLLMLSFILMAAGIGFKIASVPFQMWVPDVYEGAPAPAVAYLSVGSKTAGFIIAIKVFLVLFPLEIDRRILFGVLAAATLLYGNLGALVQTNIKRLFGYSSISHAGYLMLGIAAGGIEGLNALLFYLVAYGISNLAAFLVISIAGKAFDNDYIDSYKGLAVRSPFLAGVMFLALLSLSGIPPLVGFFGKFDILMAVVHAGILWLALLGALLVPVSLYYYLVVIKKMYIDSPIGTQPVAMSACSRVMLVVLGAAIVIFGFWQEPIVSFANWAASSLL